MHIKKKVRYEYMRCEKVVKFEQKAINDIIRALMLNASYNIRFYSVHINNIDDCLYKITVYNNDVVFLYIECTVYNEYIACLCVNYRYTNINITHTYIDVFECRCDCNKIQLESTLTGELINV